VKKRKRHFSDGEGLTLNDEVRQQCQKQIISSFLKNKSPCYSWDWCQCL